MSIFPALWSVASLMALAAALSWAARRLAASAWPLRAPVLGIAAWQCLTTGLALSLLLSGVAMLAPQLPLLVGLNELVRMCGTVLGAQFSSPASATLSAAALLSLGLVAARFVTVLLSRETAAASARRHQRRSLTLVGRVDDDGVTVVDHTAPAVYCVPGAGGRIVATRAATEILTSEQMRGVVAHERAHLRHHHHLALAAAGALASTFRGIRAFELGADQIARLVEMQADDAAGRASRPDLAMALLRLSGGPTLGALSAGGATVDRARRLLSPASPIGRVHRMIVLLAAAVALVAPVAVGVAPGLLSSTRGCCPLPLASPSVSAAGGSAAHRGPSARHCWPDRVPVSTIAPSRLPECPQ